MCVIVNTYITHNIKNLVTLLNPDQKMPLLNVFCSTCAPAAAFLFRASMVHCDVKQGCCHGIRGPPASLCRTVDSVKVLSLRDWSWACVCLHSWGEGPRCERPHHPPSPACSRRSPGPRPHRPHVLPDTWCRARSLSSLRKDGLRAPQW